MTASLTEFRIWRDKPDLQPGGMFNSGNYMAHAVRDNWRGIAMFFAACLSFSGCEKSAPTEKKSEPPVKPIPSFVTLVPCPGSPMDLLADDMNGDGRLDLAATLHASNFSQIFLQAAPRQYSPGPRLNEVGFHPGDWLRWPGAEPLYVAAAEGSGKLLNFRVTGSGGMEVISKVPSQMPRNLEHFNWPGWGDSLVITPFELGMLELFKGYDPIRGSAQQRIPVGLGEGPATILRADRVTVADIDGDNVDELLFASRSTSQLLKLSRPPEGVKPIPEVLYELGDGAPHQVIAFDVNDDGQRDLIVPNQTEPFHTRILMNQGHGDFRPAQTAWPYPVQQGLRYADIAVDHDGRAYLAVVGFGALALYQVPKPWGETAPAPVKFIKIKAQGMSSDIILRDMDGDQDLDVVVGYASSEHGVVVIHGPLWQHMDELAAQGFTLD
jgi:hypothetical protein